jgi:aconitate decarboxylase
LESILVKPYVSMAATHCSVDTVAALKEEYPDMLRDRALIMKIMSEMSESGYKHGGG